MITANPLIHRSSLGSLTVVQFEPSDPVGELLGGPASARDRYGGGEGGVLRQVLRDGLITIPSAKQ